MIGALGWLLACGTPVPPAEPVHPVHASREVDAGSWWVRGGPGPRQLAVGGDHLAVVLPDRTILRYDGAGAQVGAPIDADCPPQGMCLVPLVDFAPDGSLVVVRASLQGEATVQVGAGPSRPLPRSALPWAGEDFGIAVPRKWGPERRPLLVARDGSTSWILAEPSIPDDAYAVSADRRHVAWSDWAGRVHLSTLGVGETRVWDPPPDATRVGSLAWSPSGARLVAQSGEILQVLDPAGERLAGRKVAGLPRDLVGVDDGHAIGWTATGVACLDLSTLEIAGTWSLGAVSQAVVLRAPSGVIVGIRGEVSGVARIDAAHLCGLQR